MLRNLHAKAIREVLTNGGTDAYRHDDPVTPQPKVSMDACLSASFVVRVDIDFGATVLGLIAHKHKICAQLQATPSSTELYFRFQDSAPWLSE